MSMKNRILACCLLVCCAACAGIRSEVFRKETDHLFSQGLKSYQAGKYDQAEASFRQVVELDPNHAQAFANLGHTLCARKKCRESVGYYSQALTLEPELKNKLLPFLARAALGSRAEILEEHGIRLKNAYLYLKQGDHAGLERALGKEPQVPLNILASDRESLTRAEQMEFEQMASDRPWGRQGHFEELFLAHVLAVSGRNDWAAKELFEQELPRSSPNELSALHETVGDVCLRMGLSQEAAGYYLRALKARPKDPVLESKLARLYGFPPDMIRDMSHTKIQNAPAMTPSVQLISKPGKQTITTEGSSSP